MKTTIISDKQTTRNFICDRLKEEWDTFMANKNDVTMEDMYNYTLSSDKLTLREASIWLFRSNRISSYDNHWLLGDLFDFLKTQYTLLVNNGTVDIALFEQYIIVNDEFMIELFISTICDALQIVKNDIVKDLALYMKGV